MASWRPPASPQERASRAIRSMRNGSLDGRVVQAHPVALDIYDPDDDYEVDTDLGDGSEDSADSYFWATDTHINKVSGDQTIRLTYIPVEDSLDIFWGGAYVPMPKSNWSLDGRMVTLPDPGNHYKPNRKLTARYVWIDSDQVADDPVPTPSPVMTTPLWISSGDPGAIGHIEGDFCVLDSGLVVVATFSSDTYGQTQWVINPSTPTRGPMHFDGSGTDWGSISGYEALGGPDPAGDIFSDINFVVPVGDYSWCLIGTGNDSNVSGQYCVGIFYSVDPDTLEITRDHLVYKDYTDFYTDETYATRWGNKVVALPQIQFSWTGPKIGILDPSGTCTPMNTTWTGYGGSGENRPGPVGVSGDIALLFAEDGPSITSWDLNAGTELDHLVVDLGQGSWEWAMFTCTMSNGKIAVVCSGPDNVSYTSSTLPVKVAIIDPSPLAVEKTIDVLPAAKATGWTGGWFSNVRSISETEDGKLLVSYTNGNVMYLVTVDPVTNEVSSPVTLPFEANQGGGSHNTFVSRALILKDGRYAAIFITTRPDDYGIYYIQNELPG